VVVGIDRAAPTTPVPEPVSRAPKNKVVVAIDKSPENLAGSRFRVSHGNQGGFEAPPTSGNGSDASATSEEQITRILTSSSAEQNVGAKELAPKTGFASFLNYPISRL